jgi:hypothetical protein
LIMSNICFSRQPAVCPEHMITKAYRWLLVDGRWVCQQLQQLQGIQFLAIRPRLC